MSQTCCHFMDRFRRTSQGGSWNGSEREGGMIQAAAPTEAIRRSYDFLSRFYGPLGGPLERKPRLMGLALAAIEPNDRVLEVAVGPGLTFLEILKRVAPGNVVHGVDLSLKMLERTRRRVRAAGYTNANLREADARHLPFDDASFDVLYNSYMLDLISLEDMTVVLAEFARVLRPGGRLVLVNLSKATAGERTWSEKLYMSLPARWVPYLLGGCRPVLMETLAKEAGFADVRREFVAHIIPSGIVTGRKLAEGPSSRP